MDRDVVGAPSAAAVADEPAVLGLSVADKTGWPYPVHVLDRAARLLGHDHAIAVGRCGGEGSAICDGEVEAGGVGCQEDVDGVELAGRVVLVWWKAELAVARDVKGDLEGF